MFATENGSRTERLSFEIDKNYEACKFEIDVDTPGEYTATVKDPNGNETQCSAIDDTQMTCTVKNAKQESGQYTSKVIP